MLENGPPHKMWKNYKGPPLYRKNFTHSKILSNNITLYVLKRSFFIRLLAKVIYSWKNQISKNEKIAFSTAHIL